MHLSIDLNNTVTPCNLFMPTELNAITERAVASVEKLAMSPPKVVKVEPQEDGNDSDETDAGGFSDNDSDVEVDSRSPSPSQSQPTEDQDGGVSQSQPTQDDDGGVSQSQPTENQDGGADKHNEAEVIPDTQIGEGSQSLPNPLENEITSAVEGIASEMVDREEEFSQLDVDLEAVGKYEREEQVVPANSILEQLRSGMTVNNSVQLLNANEESEEEERPITPGRDLYPEGTVTAYIGELQDTSQVLEGVTQGFLIPKTPMASVDQPSPGLALTPPTTSTSLQFNEAERERVNEKATESESEIGRKKESGVETGKQDSKKQVKEATKKISPLAEGAKAIPSTSKLGFPITSKQIVQPEKKSKKWVAIHAVAPNKESKGQSSSLKHKVIIKPDFSNEVGALSEDPDVTVVPVMVLKDTSNKTVSIVSDAPKKSNLPPLAGQKRPLPPPGALPPQGILPASHKLQDPLSGKVLPAQGILPPSNQLRDPLSGKENRIPMGPTPAKQSSILQHTTHQFRPTESHINKIPEVKKGPKKLPSKSQNKLPGKLKHRCCHLCFKLFPSKTSRNHLGITPALHITTSECSFVRLNFQKIAQTLTCYSCFESFSWSKLLNDNILCHFEMFNHEIVCQHCRKLFPYSDFFDHLLSSSYELFHCTIGCNRCKKMFSECGEWVKHIATDHKVVSPNMAFYNRFLPYELENRELILFAVMHFHALS